MGPDNHSSPDEGELAPKTVSKEPYQKPAFRREAVFETMALSCGKVGATNFQCQYNRKTS
jgi:hypothetical protein